MLKKNKFSLRAKVLFFKVYGRFISFFYLESVKHIKNHVNKSNNHLLDKQYIFVCWHKHVWSVLYLLCVERPPKIAVIMSNEAKNHLFMSLFKKLGVGIIRQDDFSSQNYERLRILVDYINSGYSIFTFVDGPKGPAKKVKTDMLVLAKRFDIEIVPFTCNFDRSRVVKRAWDDSYMLSGQTKNFFVEYDSPIYLTDIEKNAEDIKNRLEFLEELMEEKIYTFLL